MPLRRLVRPFAGELWIALALAGCGSREAELRPGPHHGSDVLVLVIDTLRADRLPFYGCEVDTAPFLGRLAEESVVFDNAWSTSAWTAPSTASLFTGLYPDRHGVLTGFFVYRLSKARKGSLRMNRLPPEIETLPEAFRALGYRTYGIADNPNIIDRLGFARGFDRFSSTSNEGGDSVNATLEQWAEEIAASTQPWLLYLHYMDPHVPYLERDPWFAESDGPADERFRAYDSEIAFADQRIAEVFERLGIDDDVLVVVTADHGEAFGEHDSWQHGGDLYGEVTRIPLFLRLPRGPAGRPTGRVAANVSLVDVLPTLRELVGSRGEVLSDGASLVPALLDPAGAGDLAERPIFSSVTQEALVPPTDLRCVVRRGTKAVLSLTDGTLELYDLERDPGEFHDLAAERGAEAAELRALIEEHERRPRPVERSFAEEIELTAEQRTKLRQLGYTDSEGHSDE